MRRWTLITSALFLILAACAGGPPAPKPLNPVRFLSINNLGPGDTLTDSGGVARVSTVRKRIAEQGPVLLVVAGDFLAGDGQRMVEALNDANVDYATFGEIELHLDRATLAARIAESRFKWISSNCTVAGGDVAPKLLRWDTLRVSTHKVGLFALTMDGPYRDDVRCANPDTVAKRMIDMLVAQGAELIVALTHQPIARDRDLLLRESRLDLVIGGHDPEAHDSVISGRHVLKADGNARSAQFVTLWGGKGEWRQAVGLVPIDARLPPDTAVVRPINTNPG